MKLVSLVTPMYNESDAISAYFDSVGRIATEYTASHPDVKFELVVVNDGSTDDTVEQLRSRLQTTPNLVIVDLARNFGQESAVWSGVATARGDAIIVLDCDLQDPPELIGQMIDAWQSGFDVVNARRSDRKVDSFVQRNTAKFYYETLNSLSHKVEYPTNVNNFRLISRRVAEVVLSFPSNQKLFRNAVAQAGFPTTEVEFVRQPRSAGSSHVNLGSMVRLSLDGIADASVKPLSYSFVTALVFLVIGGLMSLTALVFVILAQCRVAWFGCFCTTPLFGLLSLAGLLMLFCGVVLLFVSINGFYIGKSYAELRGRPMYIIKQIMRNDDN